MKFLRLVALALPLFLAGCGLSDQQVADYQVVEKSGVSSATYDKMVHGDALGLSDIKSLMHAGVSDGIILRYLRDHQTVYVLNSSDVEGLRQAGVSQSIVDYMLQTPRMYQPAYYPYYDPYWGYPYWGGYWGPWGAYHHHWH